MNPRWRIGLVALLAGSLAVLVWRAVPTGTPPSIPVGSDRGRASSFNAEPPNAPDPEPGVRLPDTSLPDQVSTETAKAAPTHASPAQRRADAERLVRDQDLKALREDLAARAEAGDADAAWSLAQLYQACVQSWLVTVRPQQGTQMRNFLRASGQGEEEIVAVDAVMANWQQRCAGFGDGPALVLFAQSWRARALALGSPEARLSAKPPRGGRTPEQTEVQRADARRAGIELLQRREAIDLLIHAGDLARHAPFQPDAFGLAACQLIEECAPDPRGWWLRHMDTLMVMGNARMTLAGSTPPRQWLIIEGQAAEIVRLWREGRFEDLLPGSVVVMPGGGG